MSDTIIRLSEVKKRTGLSRSSIYAFIKNNQFPKQVCLGERAVGWSSDQVTLWIENKIKAQDMDKG